MEYKLRLKEYVINCKAYDDSEKEFVKNFDETKDKIEAATVNYMNGQPPYWSVIKAAGFDLRVNSVEDDIIWVTIEKGL